MNLEKLTGGAAVGAGIVVWVTHGGDFNIEEIAAMALGLGSAITYVISRLEKLFDLYTFDGRD